MTPRVIKTVFRTGLTGISLLSDWLKTCYVITVQTIIQQVNLLMVD
jgi:hypothetical protein